MTNLPEKTDWHYIDPKDPRGYYAYFGCLPTADASVIASMYIHVLETCKGNELVLAAAKEAYGVLSDPVKRKHYDTKVADEIRRANEISGTNLKPLKAPELCTSQRTMGKPRNANSYHNGPIPQRRQSSGCMIVIITFIAGAWLLS